MKALMNDTEEDLMLVRDILAREIETINTYQRLLDRAQTEVVKTFLRHITEEEKEHVAEAVELIKQFDQSQAALLGKAGHWRETPAEINGGGIATQGQPSSFQATKSLTVGSLRKSSN
jgi:rubrerythrin